MTLSPESVSNAAHRINPFISETPVLTFPLLNEKCGGDIFFKCENFQRAGSFKIRGATNAILSLTAEQLATGVITHSSGNHGLALAMAAARHHCRATVVMPENAPANKIQAVRQAGARIVFCEPTVASREMVCGKLIEEEGLTFIHPSNDPAVIAGQGTATRELLHQISALDQIIVPVGGGGLLAGTLLASQLFSPAPAVFAAEPLAADDAFRSWKSGKLLPSENPQTMADGLRSQLGSTNFPIIREFVKDIFLVDERAIAEATVFSAEHLKLVIEPSSAVPLAAILSGMLPVAGKRTGVILSGGNIDVSRLNEISQIAVKHSLTSE